MYSSDYVLYSEFLIWASEDIDGVLTSSIDRKSDFTQILQQIWLSVYAEESVNVLTISIILVSFLDCFRLFLKSQFKGCINLSESVKSRSCKVSF